jgi:anti-sigma factor RsiW
MKKRKSTLTDAERADLVAYLDGELHGPAARTLEARLSRDPTVRLEAESLKHAWELLDCLPRPEPSTNFTHRTLERLAPVKRGWGRRWATWTRWPNWALGGGWAAAGVLAFLTGVATHRLLSGPKEPGDKELVRELRLIENKRLYEVGESVEFLRQLDHPDLFGDDSAGS